MKSASECKGPRVSSRVAAVVAGLASLMTGGVAAAQPSGELVILQWLSGSEIDTMHEIEAAFTRKYPDVTIREVVVTWAGDARGSLRTALLGGERADLMVNTWPSFRRELVDSGLLRPLDDAYAAKAWGERLDGFWRQLGSVDGAFYGLPYNYGDRSGLWYRKQTLEKAGIVSPPADWAQLLDGFGKLKAAGVVPYAVPAKFWAHAEIFETLLLRVGGAELSAKLATHEVAWTDERVKTALRKWREMIEAGCCAPVSTMLGTDWDNAADQVLQAGTAGFVQLGMWISNRAVDTYRLDPERDVGLVQFPAMGLGHDDAASIDSKEFVALASGGNVEAADAFLDFVIGAEGGAMIAKAGLSSPSKAVDPALYSPSIRASNAFVAKSDVAFVLGDSLPGDLADEYRIQLQHFLQDTSDANIDAVTAALEAKAASSH